MGIKTYQKKSTKPNKKEVAQSNTPVMRKSQKTPKNTVFFFRKMTFQAVFWIFLQTGKSD